MSPKAYIISLSLTGAAAALGCFLLMGKTEPVAPVVTALKKAPFARSSGSTRPAENTPAATRRPAVNDHPARNTPAPAIAEAPLTPEARAAKVETEANHDLHRLVNLLNLDEQQQDQVFQTLAKHSPYWTPEMQVATAAGTAAASGKRSDFSATPGLLIPGPETTAPGQKTEITRDLIAATDSPASSDPMSEIMALLTPEQQAQLAEDEMNRTAWWAEMLPQILPDEQVPAINSGTPEVKPYEGSEVLE